MQGESMSKKPNAAIIAAASKHRIAELQRYSKELVEHFEATLEAFRKEARGSPEHKQLDEYMTLLLGNLRLVESFLAEQKKIIGGNHV
jgi:hypothetical protein